MHGSGPKSWAALSVAYWAGHIQTFAHILMKEE